MEKYINHMVTKSLSNYEILKLVKNRANLVSYTEMHKYRSLDELLGEYGACIVLYETKKNYGHWCCIFKVTNELLEFFDPYGIFPDQELKFIKKDFQIASRQNEPYLCKLMLESPYVLSYNHFRFQKYKKGVNSCGRWCGLRIIFRNLPLELFIEIFGKKRKYSNDFYVTMLTNYI